MNIDNWDPVFKINYYTKKIVETNLVYTPLVNKEKTIMCMNFDHTHPYQNEMVSSFLPQRPYYTKDTVKFFFDRELKYIETFRHLPWTPNYLEIDYINQRVFFEWPGESCNALVCNNIDIGRYCNNWEDQLEKIVSDILSNDCYKLTLYPHCFFIQDGILKTFDFYACADIDDPHIDINIMKGIMGVVSADRFTEATASHSINTEVLFKQALKEFSCWPGNRLPAMYQKLFC